MSTIDLVASVVAWVLGPYVGWSGPQAPDEINGFQKGGLKGPLLFLLLELLITIASVRILRIGFL